MFKIIPFGFSHPIEMHIANPLLCPCCLDPEVPYRIQHSLDLAPYLGDDTVATCWLIHARNICRLVPRNHTSIS